MCKALWWCFLLTPNFISVSGLTYSCIKLSPSCSLLNWESWIVHFLRYPTEKLTCEWFLWITGAQGKSLGTETPDHGTRSECGSCNHPGKALTCRKVTAETTANQDKLSPVPPGRFHSMSLLSALREDAVILLAKPEQIFTFLKRGSLTHLLLPSPFKELSSSRFYFCWIQV